MRFRKIAALVFVFMLCGSEALAAPKTQVLSTVRSEKYALHTIDETKRDQVACLALNLYHEARGSSKADIMAVGFVVRNRLKPNRDYCDVIWQKGQFVWTRWPIEKITPREISSWRKVVEIATIIIDGAPDTINGSNSFYSRKIRPPVWSRRASQHTTIGGHVYVKVPGL